MFLLTKSSKADIVPSLLVCKLRQGYPVSFGRVHKSITFGIALIYKQPTKLS